MLKSYFKACLARVNLKFLLLELDRLIPQANITINLLCNIHCNPKLSTYSYIFGQFNFIVTLLALPGIKIIAHISPEKRGTWELNREIGWYVRPLSNHYRCVKCFFQG